MDRPGCRGPIGATAALLIGLLASPSPADPTTEVEEVVTTFMPVEDGAGNGAGHLWCYGAPMLVRVGDQLFASVREVGDGVPPLCNTRWRLFRRDEGGWADVLHPPEFRNREPCPLVAPGPDRLLISVNPSTEPPGTHYGPCDPHLLAVDPRHPDRPPTTVRPGWPGMPSFSDHSYRGIAADRHRGEVLLLNIDGRTSEQHWAFGDAEGRFGRHGTIRFPIRSCYPQVALRGRAGHVLAIGDIVEPNEAWRAYKRETTGSEWDYVFRRLFYASCPDLAESDFGAPVEVDSVEETGGHITNLDLWLDERGDAHLLYLKSNTTPALRDRFFPGVPVVTTLEYAVVSRDAVTSREALVSGGEGRPETPRYGRFHATPDGSLSVVYASHVREGDGPSRLENRLLRLGPSRDTGPVRLDLDEPFSTFFTATERGGSEPSDLLELIGVGSDPDVLRFARIRLR